MGINTVPHPPNSPDFAPSDFWLFPNLTGCRYETIEEIKEAVTKVIDTLTQEDFHLSLPEVVGTVPQVHCCRRRLLRRGLEFHGCTINKSANTKKVGKLILCTSYIQGVNKINTFENVYKNKTIKYIVFFYCIATQVFFSKRWVFNWLPPQSIYDTWMFYTGLLRTSQDSCTAISKILSPFGIPHHGVPQASSPQLNPEKQVLPEEKAPWDQTNRSILLICVFTGDDVREIIIIIIMSRRQRGYPWPSLAISPYHSSPPAGLQGYILCLHIVAVCKFVLVVLLLHIHKWGSTGVHRLWARPCFSSSVPRVWFV